MSVYERTDVDHQRAIEDSGVERSNGREGVGGRGGQADGCERAPCMATTEGISKGGSCWSGSRKQRQKAVYHHVSGDSGEGDGAGHWRLLRLQPLAFDRDAGRSGGHPSVSLHRPAGPFGRGNRKPSSSPSAQALPSKGALPPGGNAAADRWESAQLAGGSRTTSDSHRLRGRRHRDGPLRSVPSAGGRPRLHADAQGDHRSTRNPNGPVQRPA